MPVTKVSSKWSYGNLVFTETIIGTAARSRIEIDCTDTSTIATGYNRALYINYTASGAKTGSAEINCLGVDATVSANTPYAYLQSVYLATSGNPTVSLASALTVYIDDLGTACAQLHLLDLQYGSTNAPTTRNAYMRIRNHSDNTPTSVLYLQANNNAQAATYFIEQDSVTVGPVVESVTAIASGTNTTHRVKCIKGSTVFYLLGVAAA